MNSPLKFPRRVRIHGGECGAVARALHHEAQKVALTQNEQMFSSDVKGLMRQADRKKSLRSTLIERKQMSTKTSIKRVALVAVSALGFGVLTSVAPASAAAVTGTVTPVSVSFTGATLDDAPNAMISWTTTAAIAVGDTITLTLTAAPSSAAQAKIIGAGSIGAARGAISAGAGVDTLGAASGAAVVPTAYSAGATAALAIQVDTAGYYAGTLTTTTGGAAGTANDTVSFSFTTRGKAASFTTAVSTDSVVPSGVSTLTVTVLDGAGNVTQPTMVDSFGIAATTGTFAGSATALSIATATAPTAANLYDGTASIVYTAGSAVSTAATLTVTPLGTLGGLAAQTKTVTTTGVAVTTTVPTAITVSAPTSAVNGTTTVTGAAASVQTGTSSITVGFTSAAASTMLRWKLVASAGTVNGAATSYVNATSSSTSAGSFTMTLAGNALAVGSTVTVTQVDAIDGTVSSGAVITVTQANSAVGAATSTVVPNGSMVRKIGDSTEVTVTVKDQFGNPVGSGALVKAYRASVSAANLLSTGATDASGVAKVTVTSAAGMTAATSETYVYDVTLSGVASPVAFTTSGATATVINYTVTGGITSLSTAISGTTGATTPITDTTAAASNTIYPAILVPADGTANDAAGDWIYTVSSGAVTGTASTEAEVITLASNATADNTSTYTATTAGAYVSTTASTAWNAGQTAVTVSEGASVYVFATKTGLHTITVTSADKTTTIKFWAYNLATNYYTISAVASDPVVKPASNTIVTVTVKDVFGNVVDTTSLLTATAAGKVRLAGQALSQAIDTGADGTVAFTVIGDGTGGTGTITIAPTSTGAQAWASGYTAPTGAEAPVGSFVVSLTVDADTENAFDAALDAIDAATAAEEAAFEAILAADAATVAAEEAKLAAEAATTAIEELSSQVATLMAALQAQITTLANTVAKILKRLPKK